MTYGAIAAGARASAAWCIVFLGLAIHLSTTLNSALVVAIVLAWLVAFPASFTSCRRWVITTPPLLFAALLFTALLIGCFYSPVSWKLAWSSLSKYADLILIPIFVWACVSDVTRRRALWLFLLGTCLDLSLSYLLAYGVIEKFPLVRHAVSWQPWGFKVSITHNILVALSAFTCLLLAREARTFGARVALIGFAILCAHNVLSVVTARTGYVVLAALFAYFVLTSLRGWRSILLGCVLIAGLFSAAYFTGNLQERIQATASDLADWKPGAADRTSVGQRVGYFRTTLQIVAEHPWRGVGTGGFAEAYAAKVQGTEAPATTNPHNDYVMIGAQIGIPGIVLLLCLYGAMWHTAPRLGSRLERDLARGLVLTMVISGMFNSVLMDHTEGLLFAWATALLYSSYRSDREATIPAGTA